MFSKKTKLKLTDFECNLLWGGMNEFRICLDNINLHRFLGGDICFLILYMLK